MLRTKQKDSALVNVAHTKLQQAQPALTWSIATIVSEYMRWYSKSKIGLISVMAPVVGWTLKAVESSLPSSGVPTTYIADKHATGNVVIELERLNAKSMPT